MISSRRKPRIHASCSSKASSVEKSQAMAHLSVKATLEQGNLLLDRANPSISTMDRERSVVTKKKKRTKPPVKIGVVDTMFARFDMGAAARAELAECPGFNKKFEVISQTVPGFKDLAV